jgi:hypothetical protein
MLKRITKRTATFDVPMDVQELMSVWTSTLTFNFLDPVECLIRLLNFGPQSADMGNMAFTPSLQVRQAREWRNRRGRNNGGGGERNEMGGSGEVKTKVKEFGW